MLRWLAAQGLRPLLLDWGTPGPAEAGFDLDGYGAERLVPALARGAAAGRAGRCRSSATAWAARWRSGSRRGRPEAVAALVTIGAPWDFASTARHRRRHPRDDPRRGRRGAPRRCSTRWARPSAWCRCRCSRCSSRWSTRSRRRSSSRSWRGSTRTAPAARLFVALEDWLADGVPMPVGAAKDLLVGWQIRNRPAARQLALPRRAGRPAAGSRAPALVFCGATRQHRAAAAGAAARPRRCRGARCSAPAHRPRRHDRRQRRARPGLAAAGGFPRRPSRLSLP